MTKADKLAWQRKRRRESNNIWTRKYEKTINGFLMRTHRNMRSRVLGIQWEKAHLYLGLECLPREEFYKWAKADRTFMALWRDWVASGYDRKLTPSINRIDTSRGYSLDNIEWLTHSENSRLGSLGNRFAQMESIRRLREAA